MNSIFTQLLTGKDNKTHDVVRWLAVLVIKAAIILQVYVTYKTGIQ
jgi:hypothetical protein